MRVRNASVRLALSSCVLFGAAAAHSAEQLAPETNTASDSTRPSVVESVVVTGTRIMRDGFEAPTPVTVVSEDQINANAPSNIADFLRVMPGISGGESPQRSGGGQSNPSRSMNTLRLRGLAPNNTLVLLDGHRLPPSSLSGAVDISGIPSGLIQRIDVVTGGASAVYGSDALAGVVNFVLDKDFTGFKSDVQAGISTYGDDPQGKITMTGGLPFADGRGHVLLNGLYNYVGGNKQSDRDWGRDFVSTLLNPAYTATNGQPEYIIVRNVGLATGSPGGLITSGPLRGTYFDVNGVPGMLNYGPIIVGQAMSGGDYRYTQDAYEQDLDERSHQKQVFTRASYDINDHLKGWAEYSYADTDVTNYAAYPNNLANITIRSGNPFIPAAIQERMTALNLSTITMGSTNHDLGPVYGYYTRALSRYAVGLNGDFDLFGKTWNWDTIAQRGVVRATAAIPSGPNRVRYNQAVDAVRSPTTGAVICRSTLTNPNDGCVPYNVFGIGVNSQQALDYLQGDSRLNQKVTQDNIAMSVSGEPFDNWAGPVSLALGAEYRRLYASGTSDETSKLGQWTTGNFNPAFGNYSVVEGSIETLFPLAKDLTWVKSLDLNAAFRGTDYTQSGYVSTWKVGLSYEPSSELRFRATRSRDIRAPSLEELVSGGNQGFAPLNDPFLNNISYQLVTKTIANPDLEPQEADTTGFGIVYSPAWASGFTASVDYYNIEINGVIGSVSAQEELNRCFAGQEVFCSAITRDPVTGRITTVVQQPFNYVSETTSGFDIEADYTRPVLAGTMSIRALATHVISDERDDGSTKIELAGVNAGVSGTGLPSWKGQLSLDYSTDSYGVTLTQRFVSSGVYSNEYIECSNGCPTSTILHRTTVDNHIDGATYTDLSIRYYFDSDSRTQAYLTVQNVFNQDPSLVAPGPSGATAYHSWPANSSLYDVLGRMFRAGFRIRM